MVLVFMPRWGSGSESSNRKCQSAADTVFEYSRDLWSWASLGGQCVSPEWLKSAQWQGKVWLAEAVVRGYSQRVFSRSESETRAWADKWHRRRVRSWECWGPLERRERYMGFITQGGLWLFHLVLLQVVGLGAFPMILPFSYEGF